MKITVLAAGVLFVSVALNGACACAFEDREEGDNYTSNKYILDSVEKLSSAQSKVETILLVSRARKDELEYLSNEFGESADRFALTHAFALRDGVDLACANEQLSLLSNEMSALFSNWHKCMADSCKDKGALIVEEVEEASEETRALLDDCVAAIQAE